MTKQTGTKGELMRFQWVAEWTKGKLLRENVHLSGKYSSLKHVIIRVWSYSSKDWNTRTKSFLNTIELKRKLKVKRRWKKSVKEFFLGAAQLYKKFFYRAVIKSETDFIGDYHERGSSDFMRLGGGGEATSESTTKWKSSAVLCSLFT